MIQRDAKPDTFRALQYASAFYDDGDGLVIEWIDAAGSYGRIASRSGRLRFLKIA